MNKIVFFFFFFIILIVNAQKIEHLTYHITSEEGLPDKEIYRILEDKKGFVWLATNSGLYRYDGKDFKLYKHSKQTKLSVFGLKIDDKGRLWYNTINGQYFYIEKDKIFLFKDYEKETKEELRNFFIFNQSLFIVFHKKIIQINSIDKKEKKINYKSNGVNSPTLLKFKDSLFIVDGNNKYAINNISKNTLDLNYASSPQSIVFKDGILIITHSRDNEKRIELILKNRSVKVKGLNAIKITSIYHLKIINNYLWVFTSRGVFKYEYKNNKFYLKDTFLKGKKVTDAIIDSNGYVWFTTLSSGIFIVKNQSVHTVKRVHRDDYITSFTAINDSIISYIEGEVNLNKFNVNTLKNKNKTLTFGQKVFYDKLLDGIIVFTGARAYLSRENDSNKKSYDLSTPKNIIRINNTSFLLSYYNRLTLFNKKAHKKQKHISGRCKELAFNRYNKLIYIGFSKGLQIGENIDSLKLAKYKKKEIYVKSIAIKPNTDTVFIATHSNKIVQLLKDKVINELKFNEKEKINTVISDEKHLWIGTEKGAFQFNYKTKKLTRIKSLFKLQVKKIELTKNFVWIITDGKIIRLKKEHKENKQKEIVPYFRLVKVNDVIVNHNQPIEITNKNNKNIRIQFMINGFKNLDLYYFEYKLSNNKWQTINANELTLSRLPFGKQTLKIRAIHKENFKKSLTSLITFNVLRPFYKTWWFVSFLFLMLLGIFFKVIKYSIKIERRKKEKELQQLEIKQQLTNLQLENLRSQMNPHFIFNALNSIQEYIYTNEKKLATSYLVKFSRLIRIYLEHSRISEITLAKEIKALELYLYLENNRFENLLEYKIEIDKEINTTKIHVPSLFLQPYIENAIKHGLLHKKGVKKLAIIFKLSINKRSLIVIVEDNGIGREASGIINNNRHYKPFATQANLNRVDLMNLKRDEKIKIKIKDLKDNFNVSNGTIVQISIPIN